MHIPATGRALRLLAWILIGLALRIVVLGNDSLWLDEGYTAWTAHLPPAEHRAARAHDDAPPLYYGLQRILVPILPPGEASVRLLSAAAGAAGVAWLALCPPSTIALEAPAAFLSIGTYGVGHGRQARSYALLMLWEAILITATARALQGRRRWLILVTLSEAAALWTHNVAATLVVAANLAWLLCGRRDPGRWFISQAAALLLWSPCLVQSAIQWAAHASLNSWIADFWKKIPLAVAPLLSLACFTSGARVWLTLPNLRWAYTGPGSAPLSILAFASVGALLIAAFRARTRREALLAASFTLAPLLCLSALSSLTQPSYILGRTDAVAYVGFLVWCALGLSGLPRPARWGALAILAISTILATATSLPIGPHAHAHDRAVGIALRREVRAGDWVAFVGLSRPSIDYYLSSGRPGRADPMIRRLHFPAIFGDNPAADYSTPGDSLRAWEHEAQRLRARFESQAGPESFLYFVGPIQPSAPHEETAENLPYPGSVLAYTLNGLRPLAPIIRLRGDGVAVDWIVFRVRRDSLIPLEELKPIEAQP